jgi:nicotinate-nucleotide pyrophosphorylase (carboxylating)
MNWDHPQVTALVRAALEEDLGGTRDPARDLSASATITAGTQCRAAIHAKSLAIVAGLPLVERVFLAVHPQIRCQAAVADGASVGRGEAVFRAQGCARAILAAERTALNFLARLSGIATLTRKFVSEIEGTPARIRDTRKTTPLHRILEKYAVRMGGGTNHRFGLHDAMLIKENHIAVAGSVAEAVRRALLLASAPSPSFPEMTAYESFQAPAGTIEVQVEVRNEAELREALAAGAPAVLLDNQSPADAARLVQLTRSINPRCLVEVSGGVSLQNVRAYAESGADFIAIGALTHSAPAADFSLLIEH